MRKAQSGVINKKFRSLEVSDGNYLWIHDAVDVRDLEVVVRGSGNSIKIDRGCALSKMSIVIESDRNSIHLSEDVRFSGKIIMKISPGNSLKIGSRTTIGGVNIICGESTAIKIGNDCMLSWGLEIRSTDSHAIFDIESSRRLNPAENIEVGDNVWIGAHAMIVKGARIGNGCVVGMGSLVSKGDEMENCIYAGVPSRIVRRGVRWERKLLG